MYLLWSNTAITNNFIMFLQTSDVANFYWFSYGFTNKHDCLNRQNFNNK